MSANEYIDLIISVRSSVGDHVSHYITVLFAYLATSYAVAHKLPSYQWGAVSVLYSVYQFLPAHAAVQDIHTLGALIRKFRELYPSEATTYMPIERSFPHLFLVVAIGSWVFSIIFTLQRWRLRFRT